MEFTKERKAADLLVIPLCVGEKRPYPAITLGDFKGKTGELVFVYPDKSKQPEKRVALLGLGEKEGLNTEKLRVAFGTLTKEASRRKYKSLNIEIPELAGIELDDKLRGIVEGLLIANYEYTALKSTPFHPVQKVGFIGLSKNLAKNIFEKLSFYKILFEGVNLARDLVNGNPDDVTPEFLAKTAKELGSAKILDKKALIKERMGLLLAVSQGSHHDPYLICLEYKGHPKSKDKTVLIGKGVCYDTGGLNLKLASMEDMKSDMGGAAAVLGAFLVAKKLKLKINLSVVVPTVENVVGPRSFKPGSVYKSRAGKTVEIGNTDAEGRLILADAISWAKDYLKPSRIIDMATLTGAMRIAIGPDGMGLFSNSDSLADSLIAAGAVTYERAFRFPLIEEYREMLKSDIADINNVSSERQAGSITAALFLKEFVGDLPWAHLDIAPCAFSRKGRRYHANYATGVGVRLLIEYLRHL